MRILTWNINGLATTLQYYPWCETKSYKDLLDALEADIICLQEIKTQRSKMTRDMALVPGYDAYFSFPRTKHGYSGVAIYVRQPLYPYSTQEGLVDLATDFLKSLETDIDALNAEGRCIEMDFGTFTLLNIYFPNSSNRYEFKMDYHRCVRQRIDDLLANGKQVMLVGDINAVHEEIDHCDPKQSMKENNITHFKDLPHRQWIDGLIAPKGPLIDVCRQFHPDRRGMFTCWNTKLNARPANFGTRIDYILVSKGLQSKFKHADIRPDVLGSDHCLAYLDMEPDTLAMDYLNTHSSPLLARNFSEFSDKQNKLFNYFKKQSTPAVVTPCTDTYDEPSQSSLDSQGSLSTQSSLNTQCSRSTQKDTTMPSKQGTAPAKQAASRKRKEAASAHTPSKQKLLKSYFVPPNDPPLPEEDDIQIDMLIKQANERENSKEAWASLFKSTQAPQCNTHREPCREFTVTKKGPNQGRRFYVCSRPIGPQDGSTDHRCNFFQWKHERLQRS